MVDGQRIDSFGAFFPFYLREHARPHTRALHYVGTGLVLLLFLWAVFTANLRLFVLVPVAGYAFAWIGHATVERNRPATFRYPLWSLLADFRMFGLAVTGRLGPHLERAGVPR